MKHLLTFLYTFILLYSYASPALAVDDNLYIHPENTNEIAAGYKITRSFSDFSAPNIDPLCRKFPELLAIFCNITTPTENITIYPYIVPKIPWFNREQEISNKLEKGYESRTSSAAKFWSDNTNDPTIDPENDAPQKKLTRSDTQCLTKKTYLEYLSHLCATGSCPDSKALELSDLASSINCQDYKPGTNQDFDNLIPQTPDGTEYKVMYRIAYLKKPKNSSFKELTNTAENKKAIIRIGREIIPVPNVGGQKNQTTITSKPAYDSLFTQTSFTLKRQKSVQKSEELIQKRREEQKAKVQTASTRGPCIDAEDDLNCSDPNNDLPCTLIKFVNAHPEVCQNDPVEEGETAQQSYTESRLNQVEDIPRFNPLAGAFLALDILKLSFEALINVIDKPDESAEEFNFVIFPEEAILAQETGKETIQASFYRQNHFNQNAAQTTPYNQVLSELTESDDPKKTFTLRKSIQKIIDAISITIGIETQDDITPASILGRSSQESITDTAGMSLRRHKNKGTLQNSGCYGAQNQGECYWYGVDPIFENGTGTGPGPGTGPGTGTSSGDICQIAESYGLDCCILEALWEKETNSSQNIPSFQYGNLNCCNQQGYCGPMQVGGGLIPTIQGNVTYKVCEDSGAFHLASRAILYRKCQDTPGCVWDPNNPPSFEISPEDATYYFYGSCAADNWTQCRWGEGANYCDAVTQFCSSGTFPPDKRTEKYCSLLP